MKQKLLAFTLALTLTAALAGCGNSNAPASSGSASSPAQDAVISAEPAGDANTTVSLLPTYGDGIETLPAEIESNDQVKQAIADYYQIPADALADTRYYYNYVDLNSDGMDEIFAVAMGMYTSGTGGDSALILAQIDGKLEVNQALTQVHMPVIVSDTVTNGCRDLILATAGGGAQAGYVTLTYTDGQYATVSEGTALESLDGVTGTAILYTDVTAADAPALTLA